MYSPKKLASNRSRTYINIHCSSDYIYQSKIVATLVGHALAGQLGRAVDCLSDVRASMTLQNTIIHQENTLLNNTAHSMNVMAKIKKLDPQRVGGWSWDGSSNKTSKKNMKVEKSGATGQVVRTNDGVSTSSTVVQNVKDCILFHVVLWLPYCANDVRIEVEHREQFHILIQCAVCTLWRSRIASEDSHEKKVTAVKNNENENENEKLNPTTTTRTKTKKINSDSNDNNNNDKSENDDHPQSKKRKFENVEKSDIASKNLVQPTLSLVFQDGSTASITQELLTLSMARKRMAAPTEYQVLSSIIELLNDPILQLIQTIPSIPNIQIITPKDKIDIVKDNNSSSDRNNRERKEVELHDLSTRKDIQDSKKSVKESDNDNNDNNKDVMWIDSLRSLLPSGLNKKQRKKIHIIDIHNLLSTTTQDIQNINDTGNSRNERELVESENGENLLPSLSSIVYGFHNPSILHGFSHDNIQKENNCKNSDNNVGVDNNFNNENEEDEIPSQVLVLLRPVVHYISKTINKQNLTAKSPFSSLKTTVFDSKTVKSLDHSATSLPGNNIDFYTKINNRRQSEIDQMKLNKMLNEYMYGKNSKKHDINVKSVLYCSASLFSSIPSEESSLTSSSYENVLSQCEGNNTKTLQHTDVTLLNYATERNTSADSKLNLNLKLKSNFVSPGIAVCVLQHWAYNRMLLPTLQIAQNNHMSSETT